MHINPNIYRGYDIRGVANEDLNQDVYYALGRGYASFLAKRRIKLCPVGADNRLTSEEYKTAFIKGLLDSGINVIDLGLTMSQVIYFASYHYLTKAGAMITASHNPKEYNGLKLSVGYSETMVTEEIQYLKSLIENEDYVNGRGDYRKEDIFPIYQGHLNTYFSLQKKWKIVVDGCNTGSGIFYPAILKQAGCEVVEINCQPDGNYPLGHPDPTETQVLERLSKGVLEHKADLGFAYDADGDRMACVDDKGNVLWMDVIVALFAKDVLSTMPKAPIVFNNLCSKVVSDTIVMCKGTPVMHKTGHSFIKSCIKEIRSPFGGELSGHIFFTDNFFGHDDAAYASLRLLSYLEKNSSTLSSEVALLPKYHSSPEIKLGLADELKFQYISTQLSPKLESIIPNAEKNTIDGIRLDTEEAMIVARASQNGPYMTLKFEAKTQEEYDRLKNELNTILSGEKEINMSEGSNLQALS